MMSNSNRILAANSRCPVAIFCHRICLQLQIVNTSELAFLIQCMVHLVRATTNAASATKAEKSETM